MDQDMRTRSMAAINQMTQLTHTFRNTSEDAQSKARRICYKANHRMTPANVRRAALACMLASNKVKNMMIITRQEINRVADRFHQDEANSADMEVTFWRNARLDDVASHAAYAVTRIAAYPWEALYS